MRACKIISVLSFLTIPMPCESAPDYFVSVANKALRMTGGVVFRDMTVPAVSRLEQHVKRIMGANPGDDLNVSSVCSMPEPEILRILFLAVLGNFTTSTAHSWHQPFRLEVSPTSGAIVMRSETGDSCTVLSIVVILLICVQVRQYWLEEKAKLKEKEKQQEEEQANNKNNNKNNNNQANNKNNDNQAHQNQDAGTKTRLLLARKGM